MGGSCADRFGVTPRVRCDHDVLGASWDARRRRWEIETTQGSLSAEVLIRRRTRRFEPADYLLHAQEAAA